MFQALAEAGVNIEIISTSEIRITCMIAEDQVETAVRALHKAFALEEPEPARRRGGRICRGGQDRQVTTRDDAPLSAGRVPLATRAVPVGPIDQRRRSRPGWPKEPLRFVWPSPTSRPPVVAAPAEPGSAPHGAALLMSLGFRPAYLPPDRLWRLAAIVALAMVDAAEDVAGLPVGMLG